MTIRVETLADYDNVTYAFIKHEERLVRRVYSDSKGIPTLGVGYALFEYTGRVINGVKEVRFKLTLFNDLSAIGINIVQDLSDPDYALFQQLLDNLNTGNGSANLALVPAAPPPYVNDEEPITTSDFNNVFSFDLLTDQQQRDLYNLSVQRAREAVLQRFTTNLTRQGESAADSQVLFNSLDGTKEMMVLTGLAFNSPSWIGNKLTAALYHGDRAEAWFEIRYNSGDGAYSSRRYREANEFGLYNTNPDVEDYKSAYRMYTRHKTAGAWGGIGIKEYELNNPPPAGVQSISLELNPAYTFLIDQYVGGKAISVPIAWENIYVGEDLTTKYYNGTDGDSGNSTLVGSSNNDLILGESGDDEIIANNGDDVIYGGTGNDTLYGGAGYDYYVHDIGDGHDVINDTDGLGQIIFNGVTLYGGRWINENTMAADVTGNIRYLVDGDQLTVLDLDNPGDSLTINYFTPGALGITFTDYVPPASLLEGTALSNTDNSNYDASLHDPNAPGGIAIDSSVKALVASPGHVAVFGYEGHDEIDGNGNPGIVLDGGTGHDEVYADWQGVADWLSGFTPDPVLVPGTGAYMFGQDGNDVLSGGLQGDVISGGTGNDQIFGYTGHDVIAGGSGDDHLQGNMGQDQIDGGADDDRIFGGEGDDTLYGGTGSDFLFGDSNERGILDRATGSFYQLYGVFTGGQLNWPIVTDVDEIDAGNDFLDGGEGSDWLYGGAGNDVLIGGAGDFTDYLQGEGGNDVLVGGEGNDFLWGDSSPITVEADAQFLEGDFGTYNYYSRERKTGLDGDDVLDGGAGNDYINGGGGDDTYIFSGAYGNDTVEDTQGANDTIRLNDGLGRGDITLAKSESGKDLLIGYEAATGRTETVTVMNYFTADGRIENIELGDGTTLGVEDVYKEVGLGSPAPDNAPEQTGDPNTPNTFYYDLVDGIVRITDISNPTAPNTLVFGEGITWDSIVLKEGSLLLEIGDAAHAVHIEPFNSSDVFGERGIDIFQFADGSTHTYEELLARGFDYVGTADNNSIRGTNTADRIDTGDGNDTLFAIGGNDVLKGGAGDDTYIINTKQQDGFEITIDDISGLDKIEFDIFEYNINIGSSWYDGTYGVAANIQYTSYDGNDLVLYMHMKPALAINGMESLESFGTIRIKDYRNDGSIEFINATNRTIIDQQLVTNTPQLFQNSYFIAAWETDYKLAPYQYQSYHNIDETLKVGNDFNNVMRVPTFDSNRAAPENSLYGLGGDDILYGSNRDDTLVGGTGNDQLFGGAGSDTYIINPNDYNIILDEGLSGYWNTSDTIQLEPGMHIADVEITRDGDDLWINHTKIERFFFDAGEGESPKNRYPYMVEYLESITDGKRISLPDYVIAQGVFGTFIGTEGNDNIYGDQFQNKIYGLGGDDWIYGNGSDDLIYGGDGKDYIDAGYGNDVVEGGTGNDSIHGYIGDDKIYGGDGDDYLDGSAGNDYVEGGQGNDILIGWDGIDTLIGGDGDDYIESDSNYGYLGSQVFPDYVEGGRGNDFITGGRDAEIYTYNLGDGFDYIIDSGEYRFLENIAAINAELEAIESAPDGIYTPLDQAAWDGGEWGVPGEIWDGYSSIPGLRVWNTYNWEAVYRLASVGDGIAKDLAYEILNDVKSMYLASQDDVIKFGEGIQQSDVQIYWDVDVDVSKYADYIADYTGNLWSNFDPANLISSSHLILSIDQGQGISMSIDRATNQLPIEIIEFADGTRYSLADFISNKTINNGEIFGGQFGSLDNDILIGSIQGDQIFGGAGNDYLIGNGSTTAWGPAQLDYLFGGEGDDILIGNGIGHVELNGGAGNDVLYDPDGISRFYGGAGDDIIVSRNVDNDINGGDGSDVYLFNPGTLVGDNQWLGYNWFGVEDWPETFGNVDVDTVSFGGGVTPDQFLANIEYYDYGDGSISYGLNLFIPNTGEAIYISMGEVWFDGTELVDYEPGVERFQFVFESGYQVFDLRALIESNWDALKAAGDAYQVDYDPQFAIPLFTPEAITAFDITDQVELAGGEYAIEYANTGKIEFPWTTGTPGDDTLVGTNRSDSIDGLAGNDTIYGLAGDDTITGGTGDDTLLGGAGNDTYIYNLGDGVDTIFDSNSLGETNVIQFGPGVNPADISLGLGSLLIRVGDQGDGIHIEGFDPSNPYQPGVIDYLRFDNGRIISYSDLIDQGFDLYGTAGDDVISGTNAVDRIQGGAGNDMLEGRDGDDVLDGGAGDDTLIGGTGNDTYVFGLGYGNDIVNADAGVDQVRFADGVLVNAFEVSQSGDDLVVTLGDASSLRVSGWFNGGSAVQSFVFADGTTFDAAGIEARIGIAADYTNSAPVRNGALPDSSAEEGTAFFYEIPNGLFTDPDLGDSLSISFALTSGDPLPGWLHYDPVTRLLTGTPTDVDGGNFAVRVTATDTAGNSVSDEFALNVVVMSGPSITDGDDVIELGEGDDIVDGLGGNDTIRTFGGNDVLIGGTGNDLLEGGSGTDTYVFNMGDGVDTIVDSAGEGNRVVFGPGISPSDLKLSFVGATLVVTVGNGGDALNIEGFDPNNPYANAAIELFEFSDGSSLTYSQLIDQGFDLIGTIGDDLINGTAAIDRILAGAGNDVVSGAGGDDFIDGGIGNDSIDAGDGNNTVVDNDGNNNVVTGSGNDVITMGNGYDSITGGAGNDLLDGGAGDDTYYLNLGDGIDTIIDLSTAGEGNRIVFGTGISASDLVLSYDGTALVVTYSTGGDAVRLTGFDPLNPLGAHAVDQFEFNDGRSQSYLELINSGFNIINGTNGYDNLYGTEGNDLINAYGQNDSLYGYGGDDVLIGGNYYDVMDGGDGNDTFVIVGDDGTYDTVIGGNGYDVLVGSIGDDVFRFGYYGGANSVEVINGGDGYDRIVGTNTANTLDLSGTQLVGVEAIDGGLGDDTIIGSAGNDTIIGGEGADSLDGGAGDDTFVITGTINRYDLVQGGDGFDTIVGGDADDNICLSYFSGSWTVESIDGGSGFNAIIGTNGNNVLDFSATTLANIDVIDGRSGDDTIFGSDGNDVIKGGSGNDTLNGGIGDDTYQYNLNDGRDWITDFDADPANSDTVQFGTGIGYQDIIFEYSNNSLKMRIAGTSGYVGVNGWQTGTENQIEQIQTDAYLLMNNQVDQLISAMATFTAENGIASWDQALLDRPDDVQTILASYWQPNGAVM